MTRPKRLLRNKILIPVLAVVFTLSLVAAARCLEMPSPGLAIAAGIVILVIAIAAGVVLLKATSGVICAKCGSRQAKLVYKDSQGTQAEYVECPGCGEQQPTGYCLPND